MLKFILVLFLSLPLMAQEKPIFRCESPTQSFEIRKSIRGQRLQGVLLAANQKYSAMKCEERNFGYLCRKDDQVAKVMRGASGRMIVQFELEGSFGIESGYLYTISCR
ncbi:MAG: hypothetical protein JNL11_12525 [Bdellovibrionaceae bacterium]|nr:hypothetical protein [Pseudobdellovibrionaceae bacterium]